IEESLADPELWWTHDLGAQRLYALRIELSDEGQVFDETTHVVGFRRIVVSEDGAIKLNGRALRLRGACYESGWQLSETDESGRDAALRQMKLAHVNAVRVYGHLEPGSFYAACDRDGFLVWQDLPLVGGYACGRTIQRSAEQIASEAA